jgi:hypothetical protein
VPIPAGFILKDEERELGLFIAKRFFVSVKLSETGLFHGLFLGMITLHASF